MIIVTQENKEITARSERKAEILVWHAKKEEQPKKKGKKILVISK